MKYFFDTEFRDTGGSIDLISLGMVAEDGRELYMQRPQAAFADGNDWMWRNVYPHLTHFDFRQAGRSCEEYLQPSVNRKIYGGRCRNNGECHWYADFRRPLMEFCDVEKYGRPEFWGYFASYDWVALCQIFGTMLGIPKEWPKYCLDVKTLSMYKGDIQLPPRLVQHHALEDARWIKNVWSYLQLNDLPIREPTWRKD